MMRYIIISIISITVTCSCSRFPKDVRMVLSSAGGNRSELKMVMRHYSQNPADSLKLKAAYFLIANMSGKFYYEGKLINFCNDYFKLITDDKNQNSILLDSLKAIYGPISNNSLEIKSDIEHLTANFLINNIDMAFKVWQEQPWGKDISFNQFCEYILPYRVGNERPEYNRSEIFRQYSSLLDSIHTNDDLAIAACSIINDELIKKGWLFTNEFLSFPDFSAKMLLDYRKGTCREMADLTVYIMRALGIPVAIDFTPQYANRSLGHEWNVVLDKDSKNQVFMGANSNPGVEHLSIDRKPPVVYRRTFATQPENLDLIKQKNSSIPSFFENPFYKNVSEEYFKIHNIKITLNELDKLNKKNKKFTYLCVFNNSTWTPVSWAGTMKNEVIFPKLSCNIVYLPAYYTKISLIPAYNPFHLSPDGKIIFIKTDTGHRQNMVLFRKYPPPWFIGNTAGGIFQGSDNPDFANSIDLYNISKNDSSLTWQEISLTSKKAFRYYRYLGPDGSRGNIAELEFYMNTKKIRGSLISDNKWGLKPRINVDDGDILTYFESNNVNGGWVGLDFGERVRIDRIRYIPRNDDNNIIKGQEYELVYWDNDQWISAGRQTAMQDNILIYNNIPSDGLYLLHNLTKGKEERIFTYENSKQVWW